MFKRCRKTIDENDVAAEPGRLRLFWLLRNEWDDALLDTMASEDAGMAEEENRKVLSEILRTGEVPCPLPPDPGEICNLLRWETFDPATQLGPEERRHQIMRLFSTWILINAYARPWNERRGYDDSGDELALLNLVQISVALDADYVRASLRFVEWAQSAGPAAHVPMDMGDLFYRLALLLLLCASPDGTDIQAAPAVYESLVVAEHHVRRELAEDRSGCSTLAPLSGEWLGSSPTSAWLFGLYYGEFDGREPGSLRRKWVKTAVWVLGRLEASESGGLHPSLMDFRRRLLEVPI